MQSKTITTKKKTFSADRIYGCEDCGEGDISPGIEAYEVTGMILCDNCFEAWLEENPNELTWPNGQFGAGA